MLMFPWWIYLCILGILFSGYMVLKSAKEEKLIDEEYIEKEGRVFMEKIEQDRERRNALREEAAE
ncbi:SigE-dependent sporulation protein [Bacillus lacus]|uniref:SigE-dependent sporulation protein n=1 Tax=Metabacillus lacus TaxID=1983721 RepID=A0A7X2LWH2_9BACI|nr:sporulation YhaL family protein [Metabacillus lacus]MRX71465.1 SigE-dependent sporulation protein [Metabacillus lacus]